MMSPNLISYLGGETNFPSLGIAVKPKKGRALLWPSTLDAQPDQIDIRTTHEVQYMRVIIFIFIVIPLPMIADIVALPCIERNIPCLFYHGH